MLRMGPLDMRNAKIINNDANSMQKGGYDAMIMQKLMINA